MGVNQVPRLDKAVGLGETAPLNCDHSGEEHRQALRAVVEKFSSPEN